MKRLLLSLILSLTLFASVIPANAQLSDAELALAQEVFNASLTLETYSSYAIDESAVESEQRLIKSGNAVVNQINSTRNSNGEIIVIRGNNPRAAYDGTVIYNSGTTFFVLGGQLRYGNNTMYATAEYLNGTQGPQSIPSGWAVVGDTNNAGVFGFLRPRVLLTDLGVIADTNPLDDFANFTSVIQSISETPINEGAATRRITVEFGPKLYALLFAGSPLANKIGDTSKGTLIIKTDAGGNILSTETTFDFQINGVDNTNDPSIPVGQTADIRTVETRLQVLKAANDPTLSVELPQ